MPEQKHNGISTRNSADTCLGTSTGSANDIARHGTDSQDGGQGDEQRVRRVLHNGLHGGLPVDKAIAVRSAYCESEQSRGGVLVGRLVDTEVGGAPRAGHNSPPKQGMFYKDGDIAAEMRGETGAGIEAEIESEIESKAQHKSTAPRAIYFEHRQIGTVARLAAIDEETGTEVVIQVPRGVSMNEAQDLAERKLRYRLR